MLNKLLPIVFLLVGSGAGVGAGIFMRPAPEAPGVEAPGESHAAQKESGHGAASDKDAHDAAYDADHGNGNGAKTAKKDDGHGGDDSGADYVKLNNQFVVPVVKDSAVVAMVVMSLSIEVPEGASSAVFQREPKLRDSFLQVLFDHANMGGFDGAFTEATNLSALRAALRESAQKDLGRDIVTDVLITEMARQDY